MQKINQHGTKGVGNPDPLCESIKNQLIGRENCKMNEIVKEFDGCKVRIIEKDGETWFVAKDICKYFGDSDHKRSIAKLDEDEVTLAKVTDSLGRLQNATIVNEPGLYHLLFNFQPEQARGKDGGARIAPHVEERLKKVKSFKRWVMHEVLPSIHKTGAYFTQNAAMEIVSKFLNTIGEHFNQIIAENRIFREQMEYASQFVPKTKYGSVSPVNGQRRTTIRRGANVAGKGRLIEKRNPEEVGYQMDLFGEYLPQIVFNTAVNFISNGDVSKLGNATV